MKKNIKKNLTAVMGVSMGAMSMVGGIAPIFAAAPVGAPVAGVSGEQTDCGATAQIKATGITEAGVTVKAYQLVDGYYNDDSFVRYVLTDPVNAPIADIEKPTAAEMAAIANKIGAGKFYGEVIDMTKDGSGDYVATAEPGLYMVLVAGASDTVYNPALIAVNVEDATKVDGTKIKATDVSMLDFFKDNQTNAYVKSSKSDMEKSVMDSSEGTIRGDTVAVGDVIKFQIDNMTIPSFSGDYTAPVYKISDNLEAGKFAKITNLKVFVNDVELAATDGNNVNYTLTLNDNDFVVAFSEAYLRAHAADATRPTVKITYESALTDAAGVNFAENFNHAVLQYSNNPNAEQSMKEIVKNTYHYTFAIDGLLDGEATDKKETHEVNKVKDQAGVAFVDGTTADGDATKKSPNALAGATFAISKNEDMSDSFAEDVSDDNGHFSFTGLDEGVYYIKETKAPKGYTLNDRTYKVTIAADLDANTGIMKQYSITVEEKASNATAYSAAGSAVYAHTVADAQVAADGSVTNGAIAETVTPMEVLDVKIQSLPSTGGAGVAMAFAVSAALAGTTGGLVVSAKKKDRK